MGRRVLITGLASFWGARVAQALERNPDIETIVGLDSEEPTAHFRRTEFLRTDESYSVLARIVKATGVDTILHTFLILDSSRVASRTLHEVNVIGTMNLFAAASAPGSTVRNVVVKSSTMIYGASTHDPQWFTEDAPRPPASAGRLERSLGEVEGYVDDFADDNRDVRVTVLRFSNVLGREIVTPLTRALELPVVPAVAGFDPRLQFVHEDDVVESMLFVLDHDLVGCYNVAGDGLLPWSEVASLVGKNTFPLPSIGLSLLSDPLRRLGLPSETMDLLRYGRGVDNCRLKRAGFRYQYSSAGAVESFAASMKQRRQRRVILGRDYASPGEAPRPGQP